MTDEQLFYTIVSSVAVSLAAYWGFKRWRKHHILRKPFPETWLAIVHERLPPYRHLPADVQQQLQRLIQTFLYEKTFIGCAGLEITDEIRLTIASEACLLLLNRTTNEYHDLRWIYVYPSAFVASKQMRDEAGVVSESRVGLLGESWDSGKVILSWDDVEQGVRDFSDGRNVVLHEFAHQLDHESGTTDGAPILRGPNAYKTWSTVFAQEFAELQRAAARGDRNILDHYGATHPAEFFAVATETFFERPLAMRQHHRALYDQMKDYYQLDPAKWSAS